MVYGNINNPDELIWKQTSWPLDSDTVSGYEAIEMPANDPYGASTCAGMNGLMLNTVYSSYGWLDGNIGGCFWNSIGAFRANPWSIGMPAFGHKGAISAALYICPASDECWGGI